MSKCEYSDKYKNCSNSDTLYNDGKCLFYSFDENKKIEDFKTEFEKKQQFDFTGYIFPVSVEYGMFPKEAIREGSESSIITFDKKMIFKHASFLKGIVFSNMIFEESIDMSECQFYGKCSFSKSEFKGEVTLDGSIVHDKLYFEESKGQGKLYFEESKFLAGFSWDNSSSTVKDSEGEIYFTKIKAHNSGQMNFSYVDLSSWSFLDSDISGINFKFCKWNDGSSLKKDHGRSKSTSMLYDELVDKWDYKPFRIKWLHPIHANSKDNKKYNEILSLYRGLRINYEGKLRYQEAGAFYIGEMEARRLLLLQNNERKMMSYFVMCFYKFLSDYGENYLRVSGLFIAIVVIFAILFIFTGLQRTNNNFNIGKRNIWYSPSLPVLSTNNIKGLSVDFVHSMPYSFSVVTIFLKNRQYIYTNEIGYYLFIIESCLGVIILPLLVLTVRRNFKRSTKETIYG